MITVFAKHEPYWATGHLGDVVEEMRQQGAPTIRVMEHRGVFFALEGSHRLHAAHYLGVEPKLVVEIADLPDYAGDTFKDCFEYPRLDFRHAHVLDLNKMAARLQ